MAKGSVAKENFMKRVATALGDDYIGYDADGKKWYVWSTENGEKMPVAIALTVPKAMPASLSADMPQGDNGGDLVFNSANAAPVDMGADEKATLERLMKELDL